MVDQITEHLEVRQEFSSTRCIFNSQCLETAVKHGLLCFIY